MQNSEFLMRLSLSSLDFVFFGFCLRKNIAIYRPFIIIVIIIIHHHNLWISSIARRADGHKVRSVEGNWLLAYSIIL